MKHRSPESIVKLLHQAEAAQAKGQAVEDFCRQRQINSATFYRWKHKYGDLSVPEAKRLKQLETENARLKKMVAEMLLANDTLKECLAKKA